MYVNSTCEFLLYKSVVLQVRYLHHIARLNTTENKSDNGKLYNNYNNNIINNNKQTGSWKEDLIKKGMALGSSTQNGDGITPLNSYR